MKQFLQWGGKQHKTFDALRERINATPVITLPNLKQPFEIQTDASEYVIGAVLI